MLMRRMSEPRPLGRLRAEMDELFARFFGDEPLGTLATLGLQRFPAVNLWQDDDHLFVEAELPGLTEDAIELTVNESDLTIAGTYPAPAEGTTTHRRERCAGPFKRVIHLPVSIDAGRVEASCRNGVLMITMPKAAIARARHVPVRSIHA